jgi:DNA adenine methylase
MAAGGEKGQELLSPMRYPGGKRKLAPYIAEAIRMNGLHPRLFVEPFAGGASVSIYMLEQGLVDQIALGEKDELVAAFWKTVFFDHEWLINQLENIQPSLEMWIDFRETEPQNDRERALKCLFLNRTSFSGILNKTAGPLGGRKQASRYPIDCRFYPQTVIQRIRALAALAGRVCFVHLGEWQETVTRAEQIHFDKQDTFFYLDPPFYQKADRLYRYWFDEMAHQALRDQISGLNGYYVLSYDAAQPIIDMYSDNGSAARRVEILYSVTSNDKRKAEELIISNLQFLPKPDTRPEKSSKNG